MKTEPAEPARQPALVAASRQVSHMRRGLYGDPIVDADDLAQEAALRALQIRSAQPIKTPLRYMARVLRNLFIDRQRRRMREMALFASVVDVELIGVEAINPERVLAGKQELARAMAAIEALPPRCHEAFILHRFEGMGYAAIARHMSISASMVEKHIAQAVLKISQAMLNEPERKR